MSMLEIVGVFLCTLSLSEAGAVSLGGQCPDIRGIDNFNEAGYLGVWYQYSSAPEPFLLGLTCVRATYTDEGEDKVGVYNEGINNILFGLPINVFTTARKADPTSQRAEYIVSFGGDGTGTTPNYNVVDTDYKTFAIVYSCTQQLFGILKSESLWLLTRNKNPLSSVVDSAYSRMNELGLPTGALKKTPEADCSALPDLIPVNHPQKCPT